MVKKGFSKNSEILDLVRFCNRLDDRTAIDLIHNRGHKISDRTYRRIKNNIKEINNTTPYDFTGKFFDFSINSISEFEETQRYLLGIISDKDSPSLVKIKAIEVMLKNRISIIPIFKSAHVVENMQNLIRNLQDQMKQPSVNPAIPHDTVQVAPSQSRMLPDISSKNAQDIPPSNSQYINPGSQNNLSTDVPPSETGMEEH